jgi:hypothetical protein
MSAHFVKQYYLTERGILSLAPGAVLEYAPAAGTPILVRTDKENDMEQEQRAKYMTAIAEAIKLVVGPRDADYNKGGIGLRDYWKVNGINSPIQMVDMKLKRAFSQIGTWKRDEKDHLQPQSYAQVAKLEESMLDLINYAAFVICEAHSLFEEQPNIHMVEECTAASPATPTLSLAQRITEAVELWGRR